jgi:hypothetical protein
MKKIAILIGFLAFTIGVNAQILKIFREKKVQEQSNDKLGYVFGYLKSDTMIFKSLMLRDTTMKVVMMHDVFGDPLLVLLAGDVFDSTNSQIRQLSVVKDKIIGLEFNLTYLDDFSWQSKKKIRNIDDRYQKAMTKVFNSKVKYCLMQQSSHAVFGKRILDQKSPNYGQIIPDFGAEVTVDNKQVTTSEKKITETPVAPPVDKKTTEKEKAKAEKKTTKKGDEKGERAFGE